MALSDKDILITPNRGQAADPKIEFKGADASTGAQTITLNVYPTDNGTLSFEGSSGQLFSITNSLTGTIFSVNDISGIPSIEVIDTGLVKLAEYTGNVLIGTGTDNSVDLLQVDGSISGTVLKSTISSGTSPINVSSTTLVSNLNADLLDGQQGSYYLDWTNVSNKPDPVITVTLTGDVTGTANTTLTDLASGTVSVATTIAANSVALGTDTTGNYVASVTAGTGITVTGTAGEGWTPTVTNSAPNVTTDISITHAASSVTVNSSDGADGTINAATTSLAGVMTSADKTKLNGIATGATANTGTVTSVGGTGTVSGISLSGTVTTSGNLTLGGTLSASIDNITDEHRIFNNMGDNHATRTSFDASTPSYNFGWRFVQGNGNSPGVNSAAQYYSLYAGLGNDYAATGAGSYGMQLAIPRNVTTPYLAIRYNENNSLGAWQKISAGYADSAGAVDWTNVSNKPDPVVTVTLTGDVTGTANTTLTDLASGTVSVATTIAANSVALGTDTTGNYVASVTAGTGITVTGTAGEGWTATVAHSDTSTQASVDNSNGNVIQDVTLDTYGHVTGLASVDLDGRYYTETESDGRFWRINNGSVNVTTTADGSNTNPFDDAHVETRVTGSGGYVLSYTGASAHMISSNVGGSASIFQLGAHYDGSNFYARVRTDSATWQPWKRLALSSEIKTTWSRKTSNYTAVSGDILIADTSGGAFTITLPASPATGTIIQIADGEDWSTTNLTVARNGQTIENTADDVLLDIKGALIKFIFDGTTWEVYAITLPSGGGTTVNVSNDTTTNATRYLTFVDATSGEVTQEYVSSTKLYFNPSTGTLSSIDFNSLSDAKYKKDIVTLENTIDIIESINPVKFTWRDNEKIGYGVIAQEIEKIIPEIVNTNEEGTKSVSYDQIIPFLLSAVKQLNREIQELKGLK